MMTVGAISFLFISHPPYHIAVNHLKTKLRRLIHRRRHQVVDRHRIEQAVVFQSLARAAFDCQTLGKRAKNATAMRRLPLSLPITPAAS